MRGGIRRPLTGLALVFSAGVGSGLSRAVFSVAATCWIVAVLAWWIACRLQRHRAALAACLAVVWSSGLIAGAWAAGLRQLHARRAVQLVGHGVTIEGRLAAWRECSPVGRRGVCLRTVVRNAVVRDGPRRFRVPAVGMVWYGPDLRNEPGAGRGVIPHSGERWRVNGRLTRSRGHWPRCIGGLVLIADRADRRQPAGRFSFSRCLDAARASASRRLTLGVPSDDPDACLLRAMLLGDRSRMPRAQAECFRRAGTFHVFAISGLHVGMISLLGACLLAAVGVPRKAWVCVLGPLVLFYAVIAGARPSALRAAVMLLVFLSATLLGRRPDGLSAVSLAALILLAWDPAQLQDAGFVLSFVVVVGLLLTVPSLIRRLERRLSVRLHDLDADAAALDGEDSTQRRATASAFAWLSRRLAALTAISVAAWMSSWPLMAHYFGRFAWIGLPANMLVTPLGFLVVTTGVLSLATGWMLDTIGVTFNHANIALVRLMTALSRLAAAVPGGCIDIPSFPAWTAVVCLVTTWRLLGVAPGRSPAEPAEHPTAVETDPTVGRKGLCQRLRVPGRLRVTEAGDGAPPSRTRTNPPITPW